MSPIPLYDNDGWTDDSINLIWMVDYKDYLGNYDSSTFNQRISLDDGDPSIVESQNNVNFQLGFYENDKDLDSFLLREHYIVEHLQYKKTSLIDGRRKFTQFALSPTQRYTSKRSLFNSFLNLF